MFKSWRQAATACGIVWLALTGAPALADNQTPTTSPITVGSKDLPFDIILERVDTGGRGDIHTASYKSYHTTTPNGFDLQISATNRASRTPTA